MYTRSDRNLLDLCDELDGTRRNATTSGPAGSLSFYSFILGFHTSPDLFSFRRHFRSGIQLVKTPPRPHSSAREGIDPHFFRLDSLDFSLSNDIAFDWISFFSSGMGAELRALSNTGLGTWTILDWMWIYITRIKSKNRIPSIVFWNFDFQ